MIDTEKRQCFYIDEGQDPNEHGGYVPSVVVEREAGHAPLLGNGMAAAPWVWGPTLEAAQAVCEAENARLGLTPKDVLDIRLSSMLASRTEEVERGSWRHWKIRMTPDTAVHLGRVFAARVKWSRTDDDPILESAVSVRPDGADIGTGWHWSYWLDSERGANEATDYVGGVAEYDFQVIYDPRREQYAVLTDGYFSSR